MLFSKLLFRTICKSPLGGQFWDCFLISSWISLIYNSLCLSPNPPMWMLSIQIWIRYECFPPLTSALFAPIQLSITTAEWGTIWILLAWISQLLLYCGCDNNFEPEEEQSIRPDTHQGKQYKKTIKWCLKCIVWSHKVFFFFSFFFHFFFWPTVDDFGHHSTWSPIRGPVLQVLVQ